MHCHDIFWHAVRCGCLAGPFRLDPVFRLPVPYGLGSIFIPVLIVPCVSSLDENSAFYRENGNVHHPFFDLLPGHYANGYFEKNIWRKSHCAPTGPEKTDILGRKIRTGSTQGTILKTILASCPLPLTGFREESPAGCSRRGYR